MEWGDWIRLRTGSGELYPKTPEALRDVVRALWEIRRRRFFQMIDRADEKFFHSTRHDQASH